MSLPTGSLNVPCRDSGFSPQAQARPNPADSDPWQARAAAAAARMVAMQRLTGCCRAGSGMTPAELELRYFGHIRAMILGPRTLTRIGLASLIQSSLQVEGSGLHLLVAKECRAAAAPLHPGHLSNGGQRQVRRRWPRTRATVAGLHSRTCPGMLRWTRLASIRECSDGCHCIMPVAFCAPPSSVGSIRLGDDQRMLRWTPPGIHQKMLKWTPVAPFPCPVLKTFAFWNVLLT